MAASRKRESPGRAPSRKAPRRAGDPKQAARGTPSEALALETKNRGVSKVRTGGTVKKKTVGTASGPSKASKASKGRPGTTKKGSGDTSLSQERRRTGRNNRDSSVSPGDPPNASSIHTRRATPKPLPGQKAKGAKPRPVDGIAEAPGVARHKPLVLGEGAAEAALCRVRRALEEQDAERRAYNGLKSVGCGAVAPKPTLVLSGVDELVPPFRNGSSGADEEFRKYFIHPYQPGGPPQVGQTQGLAHEKQTGRGDCNEASSPDNAEGIPQLSSAGAVDSPPVGDRAIFRHDCLGDGTESEALANSPGERPPAKRPRYDVLVAHRFAMAAKGRRSKRATGRRVRYTESDADISDASSEYCMSEDGGFSSDTDAEGQLTNVHEEVGTYTWDDIFPEGMEMDERCYRSVGAALPFRTVSLPKRPLQPPAAGSTPCMSSSCIAAPCVIAPMDRVRYRGAHAGGADDAAGPESTQSLCERVDAPGRHGDGAVSVPRGSAPRGSVVGDDGPEYTRLLTKALNSGDGTALDHFATALCQVVKPAALTDGPPAVPTPDTEFLHSSWALEVKDTYTWYSGYDVVHGMSYVHPLVLHDFVPVHPLYHGDSPRVKWQGPIGRLPRMDPSKDYLRASLQYLRACAVKVGRLPSPPMQVQKLVARQYHQFESMLDRIREVRRVHQPGGGPTHKNVHVNEMIARKDILLAPLLFSPRHLLVGDDPSHQSERDHGFLRRNFTRVTPGMCDIVDGSASQGTSRAREPIVTLYDKDLEQPLYRGKRPLRMNDMPPPYPFFRREQSLARKVVYRTRAPEPEASAAPGDSAANGGAKSAEPPSKKSKGPLPPPRPAPPLTLKEQNAINRRKERELRAHERRMRLRAEMGEEAWAAEQRRKEENVLKKKIQYQTTKKCKDAIEWTQDAAKFPTTQTFNQHMVIERVNRAIQVIRETHLKKQQNLFGRQITHYEKGGGVFVRMRTAEDEEEIARLVAEHEEQQRKELALALVAQETRKRKRPEDNEANSTRDTGTGTATGTAEASSHNPASSGSGSGTNGEDSRSSSDSLPAGDGADK